MPYRVGVVTYEAGVHAWVLDLPGAVTGAPDVDALREVMPLAIAEHRSRVYRPVRPSPTAAEEWTVRKLARRIISHERGHAAEARQRGTWVLPGGPRLCWSVRLAAAWIRH